MRLHLRIFLLCVGILLAAPMIGEMRAEAGMTDILLSNTLQNRVDEYTPNGAFVRTFIPTGLLNTPGPLTFGPDGNLYVSSASGIMEFNGSTGAFIRNTGLAGRLFFGPDGSVYDVLYTQSRIDRVDLAAGTVLQSYSNQVENPNGLTFRPNGDLLVANVYGSPYGATITEINPKTGAASTFSTGYGEPWALVTGPDGRYYAANGSFGNGQGTGLDNSVQVVGDSGGTPSIFTSLSSDGNDLAFDGNTLFVESYYSNTLFRIDGSTGAILDQFNLTAQEGSSGLNGIAIRPGAAVPEPRSLMMLGIGLIAMGGAVRLHRWAA